MDVPSATEIRETIEYLNILFEQCKELTTEVHLIPNHSATVIPYEDTIQVALTRQFQEWQYQPNSNSRLILTELDDWKRTLAESPFFSAGFQQAVSNTFSELHHRQAEWIAQFFDLFSPIASSVKEIYRLKTYDTSNQPLFIYGGLHDCFVFNTQGLIVLIDFDWDS